MREEEEERDIEGNYKLTSDFRLSVNSQVK